MSRVLIVLPEAEEELIHATRWYEAQRPGLGIEFVGAIEAAMDVIVEQPEMHAVWPLDERYRRKVLRRFPYCVFFELRESHVEVVAFAHTRREPGYWAARKPRT